VHATTREEVASFLKRVKRGIVQSGADPPRFLVLHRDKNSATMTRLEYTSADVKNAILELSVEDYCSGPDPDPDVRGEVWVFGKRVQELEVYVKLKLFGDSRAEGVRLISFHKAEAPLAYPLRASRPAAGPTASKEE
jgi:hypothetical protein